MSNPTVNPQETHEQKAERLPRTVRAVDWVVSNRGEIALAFVQDTGGLRLSAFNRLLAKFQAEVQS